MISARFTVLTLLGMGALGMAAISPARADETTDKAKAFIAKHEKLIRPLELESSIAWWNANVSGKDADFEIKKRAQDKLDEALSSKEAFAELKAIHDKLPTPEFSATASKEEQDHRLVARQIHILYLMYLEKQVDSQLLKQMTELGNQIEQKFNVYRAKAGDKELSDSEVRKVLKESKDSAYRKAVWESSKGSGAMVEKDLLALVKLRNEAAKKLGFADYHKMMLFLNEQDQDQVIKLFDELDALTKEPFARAKAEIDQKNAAKCGIAVGDLMPWHSQDPFFQESPAIFDIDLDKTYASAPILDLCRNYYAKIGLPIDDVIQRSDLYEKKGKSPHAFCTDINREGDVRVLGNIVPNEYWMATMLHELGHSVYSSKNIPREVPYILRSESHILTTEGVAMMFERFSKSADWLQKMGVKVDDPAKFNEVGAKMRRNHLLIFSRWCQVMLRFEKELYGNPDQDLNKLWWDLVEKYQLVKRPPGRNAPDYASKIHIVSSPCYYHNYNMGELFACQVYGAMAKELAPDASPRTVVLDDKRVGKFMTEKVFAPARTLMWNDLTKFATGQPLSAKAFAEELSGK